MNSRLTYGFCPEPPALHFPVAIIFESAANAHAVSIGVRGTVIQAALLEFSAALSQSLVIRGHAAMALSFGSQWNIETTEPYFQIGTGIIVIGMATWMLWRLRK